MPTVHAAVHETTFQGYSPATRHSYYHIAHTRYTHTRVTTVSPTLIQIYCTVLYCPPFCSVVLFMPPPQENKFLEFCNNLWGLRTE
jgi:hypothetical protein